MSKISIIIPVYNVEPDIRRCLDSVVNQTYKNLEILLINDGSTDNGGSICDEYVESDNRVQVFHTENRGASAAKNVGIENSTGWCIGFVDADDWVEPDMFEVLHKAIKENDVPISVVSYYRDTDTESLAVTNKEPVPPGIIPTKEFLLYSLKRDYHLGFCGYIWNKLFRADMIRDGKHLFDENAGFGEDALFCTSVILGNRCTCVYIDKPLYHYNIREESISNRNPVSNRKSAFFVYETISNLLDKSDYSDVSIWAKRLYCFLASYYAELAIKSGDEDITAEMQVEMKRYLSEYIETNKQYPDRIERIHNLLNHL